MSMTTARPLKKAGRVIVGPRQVEKGYARIIGCEDGSGRIELYEPATGLWCDASGQCSFSELWSAPAVSEPFSTEPSMAAASQ